MAGRKRGGDRRTHDEDWLGRLRQQAMRVEHEFGGDALVEFRRAMNARIADLDFRC